ncbi:EAL domain-containing protein [Rossellomorea aquimaris]|uniref:putative bifunctional diguanylate cyclase/phosphodiesterase n=1 Tax=Rossellomorea aquimaris TaxID=189382 RepID=UPI001CD7D5EF|nr:EAL domain-containing protein [Rossellomorea aquimaris]MCA1055234.1 EAL domain-containing protein [Rossellomorea aquimaris]
MFIQRKHALSFIIIFMLINFLWNTYFRDLEIVYYFGGVLLQIIAPLIAFLWLFSIYRNTGNHNKYFWLSLSFGCLSYLFALIMWTLNEFIFINGPLYHPLIPDILWIWQNVFYLIGLIVLMYVHKSKLFTLRMFFDMVIVMSVATAFSWKFIISPLLSQSATVSFFPVLLYPILDLGMLFGAFSIFIISQRLLNKSSTILLITGLLIQILADTLFSYEKVIGSYVVGGYSEQLWVISLLLIGLAGVYNKPSNFTESKIKESKKIHLFRHGLTYSSFGLLFTAMIFQYSNNQIDSILFGFFICMVLFILRQVITLLENDRLVNDLKLLNDELESKVQKRTEQLEETLNSVEYMAYHDMLTELPNRRLLERKISTLIMNQQEGKIAVLLMDLDRFKYINDHYGHLFGDLLLKEVSKRLIENAPEVMISRIGGDEFAFIIEYKSNENIKELAINVLDEMAKPFNIEGRVIHISPSIGIALYPEHGSNFEELLKCADIAMYQVKGRGKNNYLYYHPSMGDQKRIELENALRRAIEAEEFSLHFQPQLSIDTGKVIGAEALIRWKKQNEGFIPPNKFIPLAEETGLISLITLWVIRTACEQINKWKSKGLPLVKIAVNISSLDIQKPDFAHNVITIIKETGVDPTYLELEITESIAMDDYENVLEKLSALRKTGIKISMDDFGTGYSSLRYLSQLPIDRLKIDRSFIHAIPASEKDMAIVKLIVYMAKSLQLSVLAEGVETEVQKNFLQQIGCHEFQGFLFSPAVSAEEFESILA